MSQLQFVVLAQGDQTRLPDLSRPKHLLPLVADEPIVSRTLRQLHATFPLALTVVVAPQGDTWKQLADGHSVAHVTCEDAPSVLHRLVQVLRAVPLNHHLVVVLGDVVFSSAAVMRLHAHGPFVKFFGRRAASEITRKPHGEIFAVGVPVGQRMTLLRQIEDVIERAPETLNLWALFHSSPVHEGFEWIEVDDYTDDVDSKDDVQRVLPILRACATRDDRGEDYMVDELLRARRFWKVAATFPPNKEEVYPEHTIAQEFDSMLPDITVLEYGCGGGSDALSFLRRSCRVTAVDVQPNNVATTELRVREDTDGSVFRTRLTTHVLERSQVIPVGSASFDVISAHGVLHHIQRPIVNEVVAEFARLLKPGGWLYVMLYTVQLAMEQRETVAKLQKQHGLSYGEALGWAIDGHGCPWAEVYTSGEAATLLASGGFTVRSAYTYHGGLFCTYRAQLK